jgi:metal-responsive CopG/Arc/MetJ family transcriptional regulator
VLAQLDHLAGTKYSRSALIERVLRKYFRERRSANLNARDLQRINQAADDLSSEALDVLDYQAPID